MRHALISCAARKSNEPGVIAAFDRYTGPMYMILKKYLALGGEPITVWILSAEYGMLRTTDLIPDYNNKMTPRRAAELKPQVEKQLQDFVGDDVPTELCVAMGDTYTRALPHLWTLMPGCKIVDCSGLPLGFMLQSFRDWLYEVPPVHTNATKVAAPRPKSNKEKRTQTVSEGTATAEAPAAAETTATKRATLAVAMSGVTYDAALAAIRNAYVQEVPGQGGKRASDTRHWGIEVVVPQIVAKYEDKEGKQVLTGYEQTGETEARDINACWAARVITGYDRDWFTTTDAVNAFRRLGFTIRLDSNDHVPPPPRERAPKVEGEAAADGTTAVKRGRKKKSDVADASAANEQVPEAADSADLDESGGDIESIPESE